MLGACPPEVRRCCSGFAKETDGLENTLVKAGIDQISQLFDKEKEYKSLLPEERYKRRLGEEKPILKALFA